MAGEQVERPNLTCGQTGLCGKTATLRVFSGLTPEHKLTRSEYTLLFAFFSSPNTLLTKQDLMGALFAHRANPPRQAIIRVFIHHVRQHLADIGSDLCIETRRGLGWTLVSR